MALLRNADFKILSSRILGGTQAFYKAIEHEDTVTSAYLVRDGLGREQKPRTISWTFTWRRFVRENPAKVQAIRILLSRPKDWSTEALSELEGQLATTPERFTIETLQKVHQVRYGKALADVISMVKHAAREEEPLLTAEERVSARLRPPDGSTDVSQRPGALAGADPFIT